MAERRDSVSERYEVLLKLASSCVLKQLKSALSLFFMPLQAGVCTPGGAESIAHQVRQVLADNSNFALVTIDAANAFNSPSRSQIAKALKSNVIFAPLRRLCGLECAAPSDLFFRDPNDAKHVLKSMMGVRQGSVLGPVFFCAAMHPMLCEISRSNKDLRVYAYMDDVSLVGAPDACGKAFQFAQRHLNEMSVKINANKCEAIKACFMESEKAIMRNMCGNDIAIVEANTDAIRLLGAYVRIRESEEERFVDVVHRVGIEPFKEAVYVQAH